MARILRLILIGVTVLLVLVTMMTWMVLPDHMVVNGVASAAATILTIVLLYPHRRVMHGWFVGRWSRHMRAALFGAFLVACILGLANYIAYKHPFQGDFTRNELYTLSDQTKRVLKSLDAPLHLTAFVGTKDRRGYATLLSLYQNQKRDVNIEIVDPELRPALVNEYEVTRYGTIVVAYKGRRVHVTRSQELELTNAILKISRDRTIVIYSTTGHDEINFESKETEGGLAIKEMMKGSAYLLRLLDFSKIPAVPDDASAVLIPSPRQGFMPNEIAALQRYVEKGGRLLLVLSPEFKSDKLKSLRAFIREWGVDIHRDVIVDRLSTLSGADPTVLIIEKYNSTHPITRDFSGRSVFPIASSLGSVTAPNRVITSLMESSPFPASWGETDFSTIVSGKVTFGPRDRKGPLPLAMAVAQGATRIVVVGNGNFVINGYAENGPNFSFFMNAMSWLVDEEGFISLNRSEHKDERIFMGAPQTAFVFYLTVVIGPLLLLVTAIIVYRRRRRR